MIVTAQHEIMLRFLKVNTSSQAQSDIYTLPPEGAGKTGIIEQHHLLPQQFKNQFQKAGLDIEKYKIPLDKADHRLKPDGLHTGSNNWYKQWSNFFGQYPNATKPEILNQLDKMQKAAGLKQEVHYVLCIKTR